MRFRCTTCGAAITAGLGEGPTEARCGYCGSVNTVPRGRRSRQGTEGAPDEDWLRIPPRVAHEPYLEALRSLAGRPVWEGSSAGERQRAQRGRRWRIAGLLIANAAAGCLTLAIFGRAAGWW